MYNKCAFFFQQVYLYFLYPANISPISPLPSGSLFSGKIVSIFINYNKYTLSLSLSSMLFSGFFCALKEFYRITGFQCMNPSVLKLQFRSGKNYFCPFSTQQISPCQVAFCRYFTCTRKRTNFSPVAGHFLLSRTFSGLGTFFLLFPESSGSSPKTEDNQYDPKVSSMILSS